MSPRQLRRVIFTWVSTAEGGAEESVRTLATAICTTYNLDVWLVVWEYEAYESFVPPSNPQIHFVLCKTNEEYLNTLSQLVLPSLSEQTVLFSSHRTFAVDIPLAKAMHIPCVVILRGLILSEESIRTVSTSPFPALRLVYFKDFDWDLLNAADALVGISNVSANSLRSMPVSSSKVVRIYNGVSNNFFVRDVNEIQVSPIVNNFLIATRLVEWKSVKIGINGFLKLAIEYPDIKLNIIGDGPQLNSLMSQVQNYEQAGRIYFHGWQSNVWDWYSNSDCLIHPSPIEGFGRVIAEANAVGLIAICPQSGGAGELVINGLTGFTFSKDDSHDLYLTLKKYLQLSLQERRLMSQQAWSRAKSLFHVNIMAEEYVGLANQVLQNI